MPNLSMGLLIQLLHAPLIQLVCSPAPAPPPATSCLHHIPVIFSSSENSSGIKMSDDSPMFTA